MAALVQPTSFPEKQPLPINPYNQQIESDSFNAYNQCRLREQDAIVENSARNLVYARCLGYLLLQAPDTNSRDALAREIIDCGANAAKMDALAELYINHLIRLFRQQKGHTPAPSEHPSRSSFEEHRAFFGVAVDTSPTDHKTAKKSALRRDGYRCMITGCVDSTSYQEMTEAERQAFGLSVSGGGIRPTNFCHIFPPPMNRGKQPQEENDPKTSYSGSMWAILDVFGGVDVLTELNGDQIHRLSNGLTMGMEAHHFFDSLYLWFEEVPGKVNTYVVKTLHPLPAYNRLVTFTTTTNLELPNPEYLRLHAIVCRVAHMSGAAGYLDLFDRDMDTTQVLARDGSSVDLLNTKLHQVLLSA